MLWVAPAGAGQVDVGQRSPGTAAGTVIVNSADAAAFGRVGARSNRDLLIVAERLDVLLAGGGAIIGDTVAATLIGAGNGVERVRISARSNDATAVRLIAIDRDGDGRFDPARDGILRDGDTSPLTSGATVKLLIVLAGVPAAGALVTVTARAGTGSGAPGTVFAGRGDGGGDAVVGATGAVASVTARAGAAATLVKAQQLLDGAEARAGALVRYTLVARFAAAVADARVVDPVPAGAAYVPGTLSLDGRALPDGDDPDTVAVALGDAASGTSRTVQFTVRLR